jgi:hypothetical protein
MGFYSTLPSSALAARLCELEKEIEVKWFDREEIERLLIKSATGIRLAKRYFPKSMRIWEAKHRRPADLGVKPDNLICEFCGKDLLCDMQRKGAARSLVTFWGNRSSRSVCVADLHWTCKGNCDFSVATKWQQEGWQYQGWADLSDYCIPAHFLRTVMILVNKLARQEVTKQASEKFKTLLFATFPFIARDITTDEREELNTLIKYFW